MLPLVIDKVSKQFKQQQILNSISLQASAGEIMGLVGLNGVGKTTLIKIMLGLMTADAGEVWFLGKKSPAPESRNNIAYLPEKFLPSPFLTGHEFLSLTLASYGKKYHRQAAEEKAAFMGLPPDIFTKRIGKYSKGMGQKLGLIAVLMTEAPLLILDEPMSGLDPLARIQLKQLLQSYCAKGKTVFFSSHILADMDEMCSSMTLLHQGQLLFTGAPALFKQQYNVLTLEAAFLAAIKAS